MERRSLRDEEGDYEVTVGSREAPARVLLFAVGGGGDPTRHLPLLESFHAAGCAVVAPHFERLASPWVPEPVLARRLRRLRASLAALELAELPCVGVGHSLGAAALLGLAGATLWTRSGERVACDPLPRLERLALLAPATDFVRAPGALDAVRVPLLVCSGSADTLTPPSSAAWLREALAGRAEVTLRVTEGAGHFSFMHAPPPQSAEPLADRAAFLDALTETLRGYLLGEAER